MENFEEVLLAGDLVTAKSIYEVCEDRDSLIEVMNEVMPRIIERRNHTTLRFILEHGANPNIYYDENGQHGDEGTPLNQVITIDDAIALHILMQHGCKIDGQEEEAECPLTGSIMEGHLVQEILAYNPDVNRKAGDHCPLAAALRIHPLNKAEGEDSPDFELAEELLRRGAELNYIYCDYGYAATSVQIAFQNRRMDVVRWLLKQGATLRPKYDDMLQSCSPQTMMTISLEEREDDLFQLLVKEFRQKLRKDQTLLISITKKIIEMDDVRAYSLLGHNGVPVIVKHRGWTPVYHAIKRRAINILNYLLDGEKEPNLHLNYEGQMTLLQRYVDEDKSSEWTVVMKRLSRRISEYKETARELLYDSVVEGNEKRLFKLVKGTYLDHLPPASIRTHYGSRSLLTVAYQNGHRELVKRAWTKFGDYSRDETVWLDVIIKRDWDTFTAYVDGMKLSDTVNRYVVRMIMVCGDPQFLSWLASYYYSRGDHVNFPAHLVVSYRYRALTQFATANC